MSNAAFEFDHIHIISRNPKDSAHWYVQMFGADTLPPIQPMRLEWVRPSYLISMIA